jgi:hypothetical protein
MATSKKRPVPSKQLLALRGEGTAARESAGQGRPAARPAGGGRGAKYLANKAHRETKKTA